MQVIFVCALIVLAVDCCFGFSEPEKTTNDDGMAALDEIIAINTKSSSTFSIDPAEVKLIDGDIVATSALLQSMDSYQDKKFDAINGGQWPRGEVPFVFSSSLSSAGRNAVDQAVQHYNDKTCIKWKKYSSARAAAARGSYVEFIRGRGCYSMIGRQGGKQQISLGNGCETLGIAVHEMMHALGFYHEQSRRDRDRYITIYFSNISPAMRYNFQMYNTNQASTLGEPYDKKSVMHYGSYAFSTNGRKTIVSKSNPSEQLGQRNGLSQIDIAQLKKYYKCSGTTTDPPPKPKACKDNYSFCSELRSCCDGNNFVKTNCRRTCAVCTVEACSDKHRHCDYWSKYDYCKNINTREYMAINCKKSCKKCT